ncbi:MAG: hypothetical protein AAGC66_12520 [Leifsonia sp.]
MHIITTPQIAVDDVLHAVRSAFLDLSQHGDDLAPQTVIPLPADGDVIAYPAVLPSAGTGVFSMKLSPYLPQATGAPIVTAWTILLSLETGDPIALINSSALTAERTAATSVLAVEALHDGPVKRAAVIGLGPLGAAHARYLHHIWPEAEIVGYSRSSGGSAGLTRAASVEAAVEDADAVLLCTSAAADVIDPRLLAPGVVVTSISTNAAGAREIPAEAVKDLDVYVDDARTPEIAAELRDAKELGWDGSNVRGTLAQLLGGSAQAPSGDRVAYFRSVGLGLEDAAVAWAALA